MSNHDNEKIEKQSKEEVVVSKNVAVSFHDNRHADDLKSTIINLFRKKEKRKKAEKVWPLKDITFSGYQGEILGIIGSNGAGKTTLSKIITGILEQDQGTMHVDGNVTALFSFGMGFNKELTGRENVYLNGMMLGINKQLIHDYIEDIHAFSEIGQFFDQPMKYYSSGMKARLGFSVASHLQPEVLILDEALNTGDVKFGRKAAEKLKQLVANAKIVIIVTHSLRYAQKNCDRLIWLDNGHVKEIGDPKTVIEHYKETVPPVARQKRQKRSLNVTKTETNVGKKSIVTAENVGVSFKLQNKKEDYWALRNVSFDIKEGEVVGIIGHNGAGKSTLCKAITNILKPDEGTLTVNGQTSSLLGYGTGFNAQLTGTDNIYLNAMLLGIPKERVDEKYDEIIEFSGIKKAIDKPVKHYSAGMKSRLGFSIAAILKPDVFIVDEALSTGDLAFQEKASVRIQEMMDHAKAVIIVSHSMGFVEKVCTRGIWMEQGQVKFDGTAEEAVAKYREAMGVQKKTVKKNTGIVNAKQPVKANAAKIKNVEQK
ncbi:ABC transporter ATP-binding protein [Oceanobacillus sp. CFH 90083]|uniref:ABC transporter ATP-binding protein n=1 Tax=Oceanobacillus sp. CFH 90083 TaxID=2592336 RepID=UPI00128D5A1F|nr:ABC transporter ATP-binding protein [Oceanobacillus sp. CFH 90083]